MPITVEPSASITLVRGDTLNARIVRWTVTENGAEISGGGLAGWTARMKVVDSEGATVLDVDTAGAAGNRLRIVSTTEIEPDVAKEVTEDFALGGHKYDLELTSPTGARITVLNRVGFKVKEDIATPAA